MRVYYLLRALAQVHAVTLVSFAFDTAQPEQPGDLRSLCAGLRVVPVNPFTVNRAGALRTFLSPSPVVSRPIPTMSTLVADVLRTNTIDAVIASTEMTAEYALRAQRTPASTVKILEEHNSLTRWMRERYAEQTNLAQRMRCWVSWQKTRRYEARLFRQFDLVTMVSEQDRAVCLTDLPGYRGRVEVVSNGVDCTHNRPGPVAAPAGRLGLQRQPDLQRQLRRHALVPGRDLPPHQGAGPRHLADHHRLHIAVWIWPG